ncbi:MAG: hypothetical protein ACRDNZ_13545, partial [Streptosporangiaceae bacterium]
AFYWPRGQPARRPVSTVLQGYEAYFPGQPRIVVALGRYQSGVSAALGQALARARQRPCARIWLIRTHVMPFEERAWRTAERQDHLVTSPVTAGLQLIQPGGADCAAGR